ncbi:beta-ketoacyl-[acyl-carrier-protein] synthase II [bacterium]|nr:beta-ketoacyl-[acyl-carrier-protein] synthase II [Actinomycetota bacterium]MBE33123.1 beta-ketoacyl-[acyl-carrier-protein] synthase II [bacterium]|tara:strand:- start:1469 stop:2707 length:1239 start_codon:yes stop_codon:yes gene_type:complete
MSTKRVVITGMGTLNPSGNSVEEFWTSLKSGKSNISLIDEFDVSRYSTRFAGLIKNYDFEQILDKKECRRLSKFILFGYAATVEAIKQSGLNIEEHAEDIGVEIGSGIGGIDVLEKMTIALHERGPSKVSPFTVPMMIIDMISGFISIKTGAKGPNASSVSACASGCHAMGNAFQMIKNGKAKAMITGGSESAITPIGLASFCAAKSLSQDNDNYQTASKPFDLNRTGFVMGEGAGILVFEELEFAQKRGATILAEVTGFGSSGDAYHITAPAPEGEGGARAMKIALEDASIEPRNIDYINAHGTSTKMNDMNETAAIKSTFKDHAHDVAISSTKSITGHLLGAAAAIEAIASILMIQNNIIIPTINYNTPDPDCDLNYTPNKTVEKEINTIMSNSFGFGGHNAVIIIKQYA